MRKLQAKEGRAQLVIDLQAVLCRFDTAGTHSKIFKFIERSAARFVIANGTAIDARKARNMYAVIKTGGKQYKVVTGDKLKIEQLDVEVGQVITIDQVMAVGAGADLTVGTPLVAGASVLATVLSHGRHDKVRIFKMRRRKHYQKRQGHRQNYTEVFVGEIISASGVSTKAVIAAPAAKVPQKGGKDNIELIEGIGPKIAQVLAENGITTFAKLAETQPADMMAMLKASGGRFGLANADSWPEQAALLRDGKMAEFKILTDALVGGVKK
jgi:large subunit ribosomal protein L21